MRIPFKPSPGVILFGVLTGAAYVQACYQSTTTICAVSGDVVDKVMFGPQSGPGTSITTIYASGDWNQLGVTVVGGLTGQTTSTTATGEGAYCNGEATYVVYGTTETITYWEYGTVNGQIADDSHTAGWAPSGNSCS